MAMNSDDASELLDEILKHVKEHTEEFPPIPMLENVREMLDFLTNLPEKNALSYNDRTWPSDLRIIIRRLIQTFKIDEAYLNYCFELASLAVSILGVVWFNQDKQFLVLLSGLSSRRLRMIMGDPKEIDANRLIPCLSILEFFIQVVEDSDFADEEDATSLSRHVQEAASFILEYIGQCQEERISLDMELLLVLYRFICAFLAVDGATIINKDLLNGSITTLVKVSEFCLKQNDAKTAGLLIMNFPDCPHLPDSALDLILDYIRLLYPTKEAAEAIIQACSIIEPLKARKDWYNSASLTYGKKLAQDIKDARLIEVLNQVC